MASRKPGKGSPPLAALPCALPAGLMVQARCTACGKRARVVMEWLELWMLICHGRLPPGAAWTYNPKKLCAQVTLGCSRCGAPVVTKLTPKLRKLARRSGKKFW